MHLIALTLVVAALILNLTDKKQAGATVGKAKKSVMAEIVTNEFGDAGQNDEELIQENAQTINPATIAAAKYLGRKNALNSPKGPEPEIVEEIESIIAKNGTMLAKPKQIASTNASAETEPTTTAAPIKRQGITSYIVQGGDTISTIARHFQLNVNTLLWANDLGAFSIIREGDKLTIPPADGFIYTVKRGDTIGKIAQTYEVSVDKIIASNDLNAAGTIAAGQQLIIPGTKRAANSSAIAQKSSPSSYTGIQVIKNIVSSEKPIASSNKMVWPTVGRRITQYFSWQHTGVDIANKIGTPIYAADDGVVEIARGGYNGGYGNTILLNHGGGKKTRYGHASKLLVKAGQEVDKGQLIALMGSTGHSTGPHLHFEVLINSSRYNPLNYIR